MSSTPYTGLVGRLLAVTSSVGQDQPQTVMETKEKFFQPTFSLQTNSVQGRRTIQKYMSNNSAKSQVQTSTDSAKDNAESVSQEAETQPKASTAEQDPNAKTVVRQWSQNVASELKDAIRYDFINIIAASFLFVTALSWNSTLTEFFDNIPSLKSSSKLVYSITVTVLAVLFIRIASKLVKKR
mmetsp:Transcript_4036/g.6232  ORF Transcript_4036/g.6232 Transcript_4036/m.6232 type:complete len:183 (+) Transcript_4036:212-760(+)